MLVFRRPREGLGPRLAAVRPEPEAMAEGAGLGELPAAVPGPVPAAERAVVDRMRRREPAVRLDPLPGEEPVSPTPLRPTPRLGPADKS